MVGFRDFDYSPRQGGGADGFDFDYTPPPARDGFFVPSWMRPGGGDVRGTTPFQEIQLNPGTNYRLVDFTGKNDNTVLAQGSTPDELARIMQVVNTQLVPQGRRADWRLEQETGDGQFETIGGDLYNNSFLKNAAMMALPAGLAVLSGGVLGGPAAGLLGASKAVGLGVAAGLGSTVGNLAVGRGLGTSLLSGGITGLTAGALSGLGSAGGSAVGAKASAIPSDVLSGATSGALSGASAAGASTFPTGALAGLGGEILVTAPRIAANNALASGLGGSLAAGTPGIRNIFGPQESGNMPATEDELINVIGARPDNGLALGDFLSVPASAFADQNEITVTASPTGNKALDTVIGLGGVGGVGLLAGLSDPSVAANALQGAEGVSQGIGSVNPSAGAAAGLPGAAAAPGGLAGLAAKVGGLTTAQKLALAGNLAGLLGGAGGVAGGTPGTSGPIGPVNRNPIFSASLPAAGSLFANSAGSASPFSGDWNRYAMDQGQQSFGALRAASPAPATSSGLVAAAPGPTAAQSLPAAQLMGGPAGYIPDTSRFADGGTVRGPGGPRDDRIKALLSDGEYVIDAETVSLLGDGSTEKGAQRLDEFRSNVRRHKGEHLARGKFSADAKPPESYLRQGTQ